MARRLVLVATFFLFALATVLAVPAHADSTTIQTNCSPADCGDFIGFDATQTAAGTVVTGAAVSGLWYSDNSANPLYSVTFTTDAPTSSTTTYNSFNNNFVDLQSTYGAGGTLQITGPDGFVFSGTFTAGTYSLGGDATDPDGLYQGEVLNMGFTGLSNDGTHWTGDLNLFELLDTGEEGGGFTMTSTPEPASLLLVGIGLLLIAFRKRAVMA